MRYFIEEVKIYKSVNKKGNELQAFVIPMELHLVADELSLDALKADIKNKVEQLNQTYSRGRALTMYESRQLQGRVWSIYVERDYDKKVALIFIKEVRGIYRFSEKMHTLIGETEEHL